MMKRLPLGKAFTLMESGPVVLVTTRDGGKNNIMTISWTMVVDFTPLFAMTTGPWNHSYAALRRTRECVLAIPTVDLIDRVVGIGTCSGADTDKFKKFGLTPVKGKHVGPPLIKECLANIECNVIDIGKSTTSSSSTASPLTSTVHGKRNGPCMPWAMARSWRMGASWIEGK